MVSIVIQRTPIMTGNRSGTSSPEIGEEQRCTLWVGGISDKVTEEIIYELFSNAGPVKSVKIPVDKETKKQKAFCFIIFSHEESVPFAIDLFQDITLFGRSLRMQNKATGAGMQNQRQQNQSQQSQQQFLHQRSISAPGVFMDPYLAQAQAQAQAQQQFLAMMNGFQAFLPNQPPLPQQPMMFSQQSEDRSRNQHRDHRQTSHYGNDDRRQQQRRQEERDRSWNRRDSYDNYERGHSRNERDRRRDHRYRR